MENKEVKKIYKAFAIGSIVSFILTLLITVLIVTFIVMPQIKLSIEKKSLRIISIHDLLRKRAAQDILLLRVIEIEKAMMEVREKNNCGISKNNRLTCKEFEQYVSWLYVYQYQYGLDPLGFIANTCGETAWNKNNISSAMALGLNQVMDRTWQLIDYWAFADFRRHNRFDVYFNTRNGLHYWLICRNLLEKELNREAKIKEIAMAYNCGTRRVIQAIKKNNLNLLPAETIKHGKKVQWYYDKIKNNDLKNFEWYKYGRKK